MSGQQTDFDRLGSDARRTTIDYPWEVGTGWRYPASFLPHGVEILNRTWSWLSQRSYYGVERSIEERLGVSRLASPLNLSIRYSAMQMALQNRIEGRFFELHAADKRSMFPLNQTTSTEYPILIWAYMFRDTLDTQTLKRLIKSSNWDVADTDGNTLAHHAARQLDVKWLRLMIDHCDHRLTANNLGQTPMDLVLGSQLRFECDAKNKIIGNWRETQKVLERAKR